MFRTTITLCCFAGLSLWASAQTSAPITSDELKLLRTHRVLLDELIDHGLKMSDAGTPLDRAEECRKTAVTLGVALKSAAEDPTSDPERLVELSDHLATVVEGGLVPNLNEARRQIHPASPDFPKLKKVHELARQDLDRTQQAFPTSGKMSQSRKVAEAKRKLADVGSRITIPE